MFWPTKQWELYVTGFGLNSKYSAPLVWIALIGGNGPPRGVPQQPTRTYRYIAMRGKATAAAPNINDPTITTMALSIYHHGESMLVFNAFQCFTYCCLKFPLLAFALTHLISCFTHRHAHKMRVNHSSESSSHFTALYGSVFCLS